MMKYSMFIIFVGFCALVPRAGSRLSSVPTLATDTTNSNRNVSSSDTHWCPLNVTELKGVPERQAGVQVVGKFGEMLPQRIRREARKTVRRPPRAGKDSLLSLSASLFKFHPKLSFQKRSK